MFCQDLQAILERVAVIHGHHLLARTGHETRLNGAVLANYLEANRCFTGPDKFCRRPLFGRNCCPVRATNGQQVQLTGAVRL